MNNHIRRFSTWIRSLGRRTALVLVAILVVLGSIVTNLFSSRLDTLLKDYFGESRYFSLLSIATLIAMVIAVAVYLHDHRNAATPDLPDTNKSPDPTTDRHNRQVLRDDMRLRIKERLETAPKLIPLRLATRPDAITPPGDLIRPYDLSRRQPGHPDELLPPHTKISTLYVEHNRQLLILGAPGAGKTFLLHELARDLLTLADRDINAPIPAIFSLSSWQPNTKLAEWLVADLAQRYGAKQQVLADLLRTGALLPLLDGLDELPTHERRIQCITAINTYRQEQDRLPSLVITCREHEYATLPPLRVNTAIVVQPLTPTQIARYLDNASYRGLRVALESDSALADLARTPLLLELMTETYRDRAPQLPTDTDAETLRTALLEAYADRCLATANNSHTLNVPPQHLRAFLNWLAHEMTIHPHQKDFHLEFIQPTWLSSSPWRWTWRGLCGIITGIPIGLVGGLVTQMLYGPRIGLTVGLGAGLIGGLLFNLSNIVLVETVTWSLRRFTIAFGQGVGSGLVIGIISQLRIAPTSGPFAAIFGGLLGGLILGLHDGIQTGELSERTSLNHGIQRSRRSAWTVGGGVGLLVGLLFGLFFGLFFGLGINLSTGIVAGTFIGAIGFILGAIYGLLRFGGTTLIKHYILRLLLALCTPAPLNIARWLEEARTRGLLVRVGGGYRFYHELLHTIFLRQRNGDTTPPTKCRNVR